MSKQIGFGDWQPPKGLKKYINQILKSRRLTYGPISEKLEKHFASLNGLKYSIFCSSGTAALFTALGVLKNLNAHELAELDIKRKYVVLPSTTFISDVNVVTMNGLEPIFVDIAHDYNLSYADLESKLKKYGQEVFAVMPSSLMGRPINGHRIREILDLYAPKAFFILDSCENLCSQFDGQYAEALADFTCYSTYLSHLLIGGAVGGFLGTNNEKYAIHARSFINHGRHSCYTNIDDDNNVNEATLKDITANRFKFIQPGLNFRMGEVEAAFALSMLEDDFNANLEKRKRNAEFLITELSRFNLILPPLRPEEENRHMMLPIKVVNGDKWPLIHYLEKKGIETREVLPLFGHPVTNKYFGNEIQFQTDFPNSYATWKRGFYLGCHQYLEQEDLDYIVSSFAEWFK